jgi:type IV secretory pathway VirB2 component (pilin)
MNILKRNQRSSGFIRSVLLAVFFIIPSIACAQSFTPLTSLPGVADATSSPDLAAFLSNIYKLCIGVAAILAVLKIIQGGITYMLGDSITEKKEAKHHISMAILGLVLVLSPALVFGIIDPRILSLDIGKSISGLATTPGDGSGNQNGDPADGADTGADNGGGTPDTSNPDTSTDANPDNTPATPPPLKAPTGLTSVTAAYLIRPKNDSYYRTAYTVLDTYPSGWSCTRIRIEEYVNEPAPVKGNEQQSAAWKMCDSRKNNLPGNNGTPTLLVACIPSSKGIQLASRSNICANEKGEVVAYPDRGPN